MLISAFGSGFVLPFLLIYLHVVRGLSLPAAGLVAAVNGLAAGVSAPLFGSLIDSVGLKLSLAVSLILCVAGNLGFLVVHSAFVGLCTSLVWGAGRGGLAPAQTALVSVATPEAMLRRAFALQRAGSNLGIGLGAVAGGFIVASHDVTSYYALFVVNAASYVVYGLLIPLLTEDHRPSVRTRESERTSVSTLLRLRAFRCFIVVNFLYFAAGASLFELIPLYAKVDLGIAPHIIGLVFFANTMAVVLCALPIARATEHLSLTTCLAGFGVITAACWIATLLARSASTRSEAIVLLLVAAVAFAVAEALFGAANQPLLLRIIPEGTKGRAASLMASAWSLGLAAGPAIGGLALRYSTTWLWLGGATLLVLGAGGVTTIRVADASAGTVTELRGGTKSSGGS